MKIYPGITIISLLYVVAGITSIFSIFLSFDVFSLLDTNDKSFDNLLWTYLPYGLAQFAIAGLLMSAKNIGRIITMGIVGVFMILDPVRINKDHTDDWIT